jgi:hypothetical protein
MPAYSGCSGGLAPPKDLSKSPGNCAPVLHLRDNAQAVANPVHTGVSRRAFMVGLGAAALPLSSIATGAQQLLPINAPGVDHLDIIVPDVAASARFYMSLFNTRLHAQPFQGGFR